MSAEKLLWDNDATELAALVRKGAITPLELVDASIARVEQTNAALNAVAERLFDTAREHARSAKPDAPFSGVPIAIKDLDISLKGVASHGGSGMPAFVPEYDSVLTERFLAAGFIPVVTSTAPEFGLRLVTESDRFGITRNPWNTKHVTGGSSGGSAALVSAGAVPVAHASDGGGSIRVPSACTGLVGMKPSRGRVPLTPDVSEAWHGLVVQHAVTRSVRDSAAMLDFSCAHDFRSPYTAPAPAGPYVEAAKRKTGGMNIGVYRASPLGLEVSEETDRAMNAAIELAVEAGHTTEEIDLPMIGRDFFADFGKVVASGVSGKVRMEAARCGRSITGDLERGTRILARYGELISAGDASAALLRLQKVSHRILSATDRYDAVFMPLISHPPLTCGAMDATGLDLISEKAVDNLHLTGLLKIRAFFDQLLDQSLWFTHWPPIQNVTGQPAIALPVYVTGSGLPLGIQAAGRIGGEETLFDLAGQMEEVSGWLSRRAPLDIPT